MEIRQLKHFVEVADRRNFRRAAEAVNLTQQAISKSIMQLEAQIGLKLLDRDRRSVNLTTLGEMLLPVARTILAEVQGFDDMVADMVGRKFGQLRIGATPALLDDILPASLRLFQQKHPGVRVAVERGGFVRLRDLLLEGALDLVLATAPDETPSHLIAIEEIGADQNIIVVRAGHALADGGVVSCDRLRAYPRLATQDYKKAETYVFALFAAAQQAAPLPTLKTSSNLFALSWIQQSDHWWVAPRRLVSRALREGSLAVVKAPLDDVAWPLVLAMRRYAARSPAVLVYAEIVRSIAKTD